MLTAGQTDTDRHMDKQIDIKLTLNSEPVVFEKLLVIFDVGCGPSKQTYGLTYGLTDRLIYGLTYGLADRPARNL